MLRLMSSSTIFRLDFIEFSLKPTVAPQTTGNPPAECSDDNFYVVPGPNIPQICGENSGQHSKFLMISERYNFIILC